MWEWFANKFFPFLRALFSVWFTAVIAVVTAIAKVILLSWVVCIGMIFLAVWSVIKIVDLASQIDIAAIGKPAGTMITYFTFIDRFVPLTEAFVGTVLIFNLWLVITMIRWVKSFIPTISN